MTSITKINNITKIMRLNFNTKTQMDEALTTKALVEHTHTEYGTNEEVEILLEHIGEVINEVCGI